MNNSTHGRISSYLAEVKKWCHLRLMKFFAIFLIIAVTFAATCDDGKTTCTGNARCCCPESSALCDCCNPDALCCRKAAQSWCCNTGLTCGSVKGECVSGNKCPDGTQCGNHQKCCENRGVYHCCNNDMTCCPGWCCPRNRRCGYRDRECRWGPAN